MAYISKEKTVQDWKRCSVDGCIKEAMYLKDETVALCKKHSMTKIDVILQKKRNDWTEQDKIVIKTYVGALKQCLVSLQQILKRQ